MRAKSVVQALAVLALMLLPSAAKAGYCGAARYNGCTPCCHQRRCHTVMKTVRCVRWERQCVTRCRTVYDRVCEDRVINVTRYVREQRQKEVCYTVCKPVWETKQRTYTVCKPVWETKQRQVCYTVCKPVWETKQRSYTVCKPVWETRTREIPYTVYKTVWETKQRSYTVCRPVYETRTKEYTYYVRKAVPYTRTIQVRSGHWETQTYEVARPACTKTVRDAGTFEWDPSRHACVYRPGPCRKLVCQPPPRTCCKRVWVPTCHTKEIQCTKYVREARVGTRCYKVCRMVPETKTCTYKVCHKVACQRTRTCCYKVCRMVPETRTCTYKVCRMVTEKRTKTCCYKVCHMVPETKTRCYKVCRMVPEKRTRTVCYKVCHMVPETKTCCYKVCHMVPEKRTRTVCYSVCVPVCEQKTIKVYKCVPRKVSYTVTRCVPRVYCKQVPVRVRCRRFR